uniref:Uncharacterized protein n=1 Tax=Octopus bimaculoides TaxID=37653 RepID=A0A0L8FGB3_OCTBM
MSGAGLKKRPSALTVTTETGNEVKWIREKLLQSAYEVNRKLFADDKCSSVKCTEDELDRYIQEPYSDPQ